MWQSQVEIVHYSVFNWLNYISNLRTEFGTLLAERWDLLKLKFELSEKLTAAVVTSQIKKKGSKRDRNNVHLLL